MTRLEIIWIQFKAQYKQKQKQNKTNKNKRQNKTKNKKNKQKLKTTFWRQMSILELSSYVSFHL